VTGRLHRTSAGEPFVGADGSDEPIERFAAGSLSGSTELEQLLRELAAGFGRRHWWPAASPFEVAVGAVLTQNTAWRNVELALTNLRAAGALEATGLADLAAREAPAAEALSPLEVAIRPSGFFRAKAKKLAALVTWWQALGPGPRGPEEALASRPLGPLRAELLAVHGVGPETADSILCYAGGRPVAVVDAYTRRILGRHGLVPGADRAPYEELRAWLEARLLPEQLVLEEFHALCVAAGYDNCKPTPRCDTCPAPEPDML